MELLKLNGFCKTIVNISKTVVECIKTNAKVEIWERKEALAKICKRVAKSSKVNSKSSKTDKG